MITRIYDSGYHPKMGNYDSYNINENGKVIGLFVETCTPEQKIINRKEYERVVTPLLKKYYLKCVSDTKVVI